MRDRNIAQVIRMISIRNELSSFVSIRNDSFSTEIPVLQNNCWEVLIRDVLLMSDVTGYNTLPNQRRTSNRGLPISEYPFESAPVELVSEPEIQRHNLRLLSKYFGASTRSRLRIPNIRLPTSAPCSYHAPFILYADSTTSSCSS